MIRLFLSRACKIDHEILRHSSISVYVSLWIYVYKIKIVDQII